MDAPASAGAVARRPDAGQVAGKGAADRKTPAHTLSRRTRTSWAPRWLPYAQATPMALVFALFFVLPLVTTLVVSFWNYTEYSIEPAFVLSNYTDVFSGCIVGLPSLCTTFATYLSTLKFVAIV